MSTPPVLSASPPLSSPWIEFIHPKATSGDNISLHPGTFMHLEWKYLHRAFSENLGPLSIVLINSSASEEHSTDQNPANAGDEDEEDETGGRVEENDNARWKISKVSGTMILEIVVVIPGPGLDPDMTQFEWIHQRHR
ncbi:hypothetical protein BG011_005347 [Mortierella polycephala]|uniref:Uncharacterized protein n=1 Tax=Mortierella polycephala TaxID=41804 RepID=A0A9P6PXZ1_9FUNG|nr:hypothetical protein BG011_005347 [Mortierella polycephala]